MNETFTELSVVVPVYNAVDHLKNMLTSLVATTAKLKEIIIVDDHSDSITEDFIASIRTPLNIRITKTRNPEHQWTNRSWNVGVSLAQCEYVAVVNSDIVFSNLWNIYLMSALKSATIACPMEKVGGKLTRLDPVIEKNDPDMIKGACFMFKRSDLHSLFPIPPYLVHYCGDNVLADRAKALDGVSFSADCFIEHAVSQSGKLIDRKLYNEITRRDVERYQDYFDRDMSDILAVMPPLDEAV